MEMKHTKREESGSSASRMGLDRLARLVVHVEPEALFALLTAWPIEGTARGRDAFRRLDAQSSRDLRRPDVLYLARVGEELEVWVGELQARSVRWQADRASFAVGLAFEQVASDLLDHRWAVHAVEVRLLEAAADPLSSGSRGVDASSWSSGGTLIGFNVSNRLVERGPWCAVLDEPRAWPLRAVARYTSANEISALMDELRRGCDSLGLSEVERLRALTLLGIAGRVRFPGDGRFHSAEEATMTNEALAVSEPWGHLTEEEQLDLVQEARRRWDESLAVAREEGREEGQRAELLRLLLNLSGDAEAASLATASVEELRAAVEDFTGRRRR